jgi:hypothetical protein
VPKDAGVGILSHLANGSQCRDARRRLCGVAYGTVQLRSVRTGSRDTSPRARQCCAGAGHAWHEDGRPQGGVTRLLAAQGRRSLVTARAHTWRSGTEEVTCRTRRRGSAERHAPQHGPARGRTEEAGTGALGRENAHARGAFRLSGAHATCASKSRRMSAVSKLSRSESVGSKNR